MARRSDDAPSPVLVHVVLISFRASASADQRQAAFDAYQTLAERCGGEDAGVLFWQVGENLDLRKNWHLIEFAVFRDNDALQRFRVHPAHVAVTDTMRQIADWAGGDLPSAGLTTAFSRT